MDYLNCVCEQAQFKPKENSQEKKKMFTKITDAKARICLYGSDESIQAFSTFEKLGALINNREQINAFTNMLSIMRTDSGSKKCTNNRDLQNILLGMDQNK